jgi:hypothetical protein
MMPSDEERLRNLIASAVSTPRSEGGLKLDTSIAVYSAGHSVISVRPSDSDATLLSSNDDELLTFVRRLIEGLRERQERDGSANKP